jgi:hypothetical protein
MHLTAVPRLMTVAYLRACRLMQDTATCPDEAVEGILGGLRMLREVLAGANVQRPTPNVQTPSPDAGPGAVDPEVALDADLFHRGLRRVVEEPVAQAQAAVVGAAAGILYGLGKLNEEELVRVTRGYLGGTATDTRKSTGILRGLLATAREAAWQVVELVRAIDAQFGAWDEKTFLAALPELRLAFSDLTPREIARVAEHVARMHGEASLGELVHTDLDEQEVHFALAITQLVRDTLHSDGLQRGGA